MDKTIHLTDACVIATGKLDANAAVEGGQYPYFTCAEIPLQIDEYAFDCDAILLAGNNAQGNFHINRYEGKFNAYQRTYVLTAKESWDLDFIRYSLELSLNNFKSLSQGSQTKFLTKEIFDRFEIPNIGIKDQKRRTVVLRYIDDKISNNKRIIKELEETARLIYDYWFTQFDFPDENGKPYRSSGGKMAWSEELKREIPEGWKVANFLELADWETNSQPPKSEFKYEPHDGYVRFIQNRDYESSSYLTYIPMNKNMYIADRLDILMDKYGDAGRTRYGIEGAFNVALGRISPRQKRMTEYLRSFLESDSIYNYLHNACMASTRASLSESNLSFLNIVIPANCILEKYQSMLVQMRNRVLNLLDENSQLRSLRDWLLPMLMSGQATVDE